MPWVRIALLLAIFALSGCGGDEPAPGLEKRLAAPLAAQADRIAAALAAGDSCRAAQAAARLQQQTIAAVNTGDVPPALQEELTGAVNRLAAEVECVPPLPPSPPAVHAKPKQHKQKHKREKDD